MIRFTDATQTYRCIKLAVRCHYVTQREESLGRGCAHLTGFMPRTSSAVRS